MHRLWLRLAFRLEFLCVYLHMCSQQWRQEPLTLGATMNTHVQTSSAARAIDSAPRNNATRKPTNRIADRSADSTAQSPFSALLCVLLLVGAGLLVKLGVALHSLQIVP
jgi:hypothetical protein